MTKELFDRGYRVCGENETEAIKLANDSASLGVQVFPVIQNVACPSQNP